jgi:uncharacterized protein YndB with AHSA1/START domain
MLDDVTREIAVPTSPSATWAALTDPALVARWFGDRAEIDLRVGGAVCFHWPAGEVSRGVVITVDAPKVFAFRWDVFGTITDPTLYTEVEFRVTRSGERSLVRVTEGGLRGLAEAGIAPYLDDLVEEHVDGWRNEMSDLTALLARSVAPSERATTH